MPAAGFVQPSASAASTSMLMQTPLQWIRELLASAPQFDIWAERPRMSKLIFPTCLDRDDPLKALFGSIQSQFETRLTSNPRTPLNVVVAAPGAGKTFLLGMLVDLHDRHMVSFAAVSQIPHSIFVQTICRRMSPPTELWSCDQFIFHSFCVTSNFFVSFSTVSSQFTDTLATLSPDEIERLCFEKLLAGAFFFIILSCMRILD